MGISSAVLNIIVQKIINPEGKRPLEDGFYDEEIAHNLPRYLLLACITFTVLGVLSVLLIQPYKQEEEQPEMVKLNHVDGRTSESDEEKLQEQLQWKKNFKKALCSRKFFALILLAFSSSCKVEYLLRL